MKIAVIAPPWIPIPPPKYGGIEYVVYNLVEGLRALRQDVTLFAPRESSVSCRNIPYLETNEYFGLDSSEPVKMLVSELAYKYAFSYAAYEKADVIHAHGLDRSSVDVPTLYTLHGPSNDLAAALCEDISKEDGNYFSPISNRQKELYLEGDRSINFTDTVYNCVDVKKFPWKRVKEDFFLFVGRVNWEKGLDLAVRVASKAGVNLVMAVKMTEDFEKDFFKKEILPWIDRYPQHLFFQFHKEAPKKMIYDLLSRAKCTLFTSQWEEPFGLVIIESMASGTPVLALNRGAAPEVIVHGKTGFIVNDEDEMVRATRDVGSIKPEDCRRHVERNFSREIMAKRYLDVYRKICSRKKEQRKQFFFRNIFSGN